MTLKQIKSLMLVTFSAVAFSQASAGDVKVSGEASGYIQQFSSSTKADQNAEAKAVSKWKQAAAGSVTFKASEMKGSTTYSAKVNISADTGDKAEVNDAYVGMAMDSGLSIKFGGVKGSGVHGSATGKSVKASGGASHYTGGYARSRKGAVIDYMTGDITAQLGLNMYSEDGDGEGTAEKSFLGIRPYVKYNTDMIHVDFAYSTLTGTSTDADDKDATSKSGMALNAQYSGGGIKAGFNYGSGTSEETAFTAAGEVEKDVKVTGTYTDTKGKEKPFFDTVKETVKVEESKTVTKMAPSTMGVYFGYDLGSGMGVGLNYKSTTQMNTVKTNGEAGAETALTLSQTWLGYSHKLDDTVTYKVSYAMSTATSEAQKDAAGMDIKEKLKYQQDANAISFQMSYGF